MLSVSNSATKQKFPILDASL